jgi:hypothetical protein
VEFLIPYGKSSECRGHQWDTPIGDSVAIENFSFFASALSFIYPFFGNLFPMYFRPCVISPKPWLLVYSVAPPEPTYPFAAAVICASSHTAQQHPDSDVLAQF